MRKEIFEVMKKHNINIFNFNMDDLFTYTLETEGPLPPNLIEDLKEILPRLFEIKHKIISLPPNVLGDIITGNERDC